MGAASCRSGRGGAGTEPGPGRRGSVRRSPPAPAATQRGQDDGGEEPQMKSFLARPPRAPRPALGSGGPGSGPRAFRAPLMPSGVEGLGARGGSYAPGAGRRTPHPTSTEGESGSREGWPHRWSVCPCACCSWLNVEKVRPAPQLRHPQELNELATSISPSKVFITMGPTARGRVGAGWGGVLQDYLTRPAPGGPGWPKKSQGPLRLHGRQRLLVTEILKTF